MFRTGLTQALENSVSSLTSTSNPTPTTIPAPTATPPPTVVAETVTDTLNALNTVIDRLDLITYILLFAVGVTAAVIVCLILYKCISAFVDY